MHPESLLGEETFAWQESFCMESGGETAREFIEFAGAWYIRPLMS